MLITAYQVNKIDRDISSSQQYFFLSDIANIPVNHRGSMTEIILAGQNIIMILYTSQLNNAKYNNGLHEGHYMYMNSLSKHH